MCVARDAFPPPTRNSFTSFLPSLTGPYSSRDSHRHARYAHHAFQYFQRPQDAKIEILKDIKNELLARTTKKDLKAFLEEKKRVVIADLENIKLRVTVMNAVYSNKKRREELDSVRENFAKVSDSLVLDTIETFTDAFPPVTDATMNNYLGILELGSAATDATEVGHDCEHYHANIIIGRMPVSYTHLTLPTILLV